MSSALKAKTHSLAVVASPITNASPDTAQQENSAPTVCPRCYGTGMEVMPGKGARRCECRKQADRAKLLEAARIPSRYRECSLSGSGSSQGEMLKFNHGHHYSSMSALPK